MCARSGCASGALGGYQLMEGLLGCLHSWRALLCLHVHIQVHIRAHSDTHPSCSPAAAWGMPITWKGQERRPCSRTQRSSPTPGHFSQSAERFHLRTLKNLALVAAAFLPASPSPRGPGLKAAHSQGRDGAGAEWRNDQKRPERKMWSHLISNISQQSVSLIQ